MFNMYSCTTIYKFVSIIFLNGYVLYISAAPPCPCPDKWRPPFRASQLIYSEFPEDKGRSLHNDLDRKDISYTTYTQTPRDTIEPGGGGGGGDRGGGGSRRYGDFANPSREISSEESMEYYKYHGYADYKGEKNELDDFSLESFELDPEVMKPPPPLEEEEDEGQQKKGDVQEEVDSSKEETIKEESFDVSNSTESEANDSTDPPMLTTQLEIPVTQTPLTRAPIHVTVYPMPRRPIPPGSYRSTGLQLVAKPLHIDKWRSVLTQRELSALQMMKPPPRTHSQAWRKKIKIRSRPTIIYL